MYVSYRKDLTNQIFGELTAIERSGKSKNGHVIWLCQCSCGTRKNILQTHLLRDKIKTCRGPVHRKEGENHPDFTGYKEIPGDLVGNIKRHALRSKRRSRQLNKDYDLDAKFLYELWIEQDRKCALTGWSLYIPKSWSNDRSECTASIDRIDSNKGYLRDNVQWVHKDINRMKNIYNQEYFIAMAHSVASTHELPAEYLEALKEGSK